MRKCEDFEDLDGVYGRMCQVSNGAVTKYTYIYFSSVLFYLLWLTVYLIKLDFDYDDYLKKIKLLYALQFKV